MKNSPSNTFTNNEIGNIANSGIRLISLTCSMEFNRYISAEGEGKMTEKEAKEVVDSYLEWVKDNLVSGATLEDYLDEK